MEIHLAAPLARAAATEAGGQLVDVVCDPLDGSVWLRLSNEVIAGRVRDVLAGHGFAVLDRPDARVQVTGWDVRGLRRRLGMLLAGVDDLRVEWDATAELARYHYERHAAVAAVAGEQVELDQVLADVERTMATAVPIPHAAPTVTDVATLRELIDAAEDAYRSLLAEHLDYAARVLTAPAV